LIYCRLYAGEWLSEWLCREEGAVWPPASNQYSGLTDNPRNFKLVLAEPLAGHVHSHVNTFLQHHAGPGVQHVGLTTSAMLDSVRQLAARGVAFRKPPPTYYRFESKYSEILDIGADPDQFAEHGILIDKDILENGGGEGRDGGSYILQIFVRPLFHADTFFMELIQREGSRGFGAGNIRALAQSIIEFQKEQQKKEEEEQRNSGIERQE
jgi:4-hydroxyphenylpyruvate dioxygenase